MPGFKRIKAVKAGMAANKRRLLLVVILTGVALVSGIGQAAAVTYKNIMLDYQKFYSHYAPEGKHSDEESYAWDPRLGSSAEEIIQNNLNRRHANCEDCHDPHSATRASSPLGSYFGAGTQANVSGVRVVKWDTDYAVDADGNGNSKDDNSFAFVSTVVKEYELCFKCHSKYSFDFELYKKTYNNRPLSFNWTHMRYWQPGDETTDDLVTETDCAVEFNPNNAPITSPPGQPVVRDYTKGSYHPVIEKGPVPGTKTLPWAENTTFDETFTPGYSSQSLIKCSDCHTSNTSGVRGPHGSDYRYILRRPAPTDEPKITYGQYLGYVYTNNFGYRRWYNMTWYVRTNDIICYDCHSIDFYGPGRGHPSRGKHWLNCQWHRPVSLDEVGCATCKQTPIHGSSENAYLMIFATGANGTKSWCYNCHDRDPSQIGYFQNGYPSCPRFYSVDKDGIEQEETRVHFQSSIIKPGSEYFVPLPTPDLPNLRGLGNVPAYRYYNREDDYILFRYGEPKKTKDNLYKIRFDQPSTGDRPDGEPVGEVGYEDAISLWTIDHAKDTQVYLSVDGDVLASKSIKTAKHVTDNLNNDITDVINTRTANKDDRSGWFQGVVGYGNTIDEIYAAGNSFIMDFGDLSQEKTIKLVWGVNEEKGAKLPVLVQIKDKQGKWVTRGSARTSEDRYGFLDIKPFFTEGTKDFRVKVIPTLNSIDFMAVSTKDAPVKVTKLTLKRADFTKFGGGAVEDVTSRLVNADKDYVTFDYKDTCDLYFDVPSDNKALPKRDYVFAPVGYYETGGDIHPAANLVPMTAEKAQDFGILTPAGGYANQYTVQIIDPGAWNERYADRIPQ